VKVKRKIKIATRIPNAMFCNVRSSLDAGDKTILAYFIGMFRGGGACFNGGLGYTLCEHGERMRRVEGWT
jgi:hypothetical protein